MITNILSFKKVTVKLMLIFITLNLHVLYADAISQIQYKPEDPNNPSIQLKKDEVILGSDIDRDYKEHLQKKEELAILIAKEEAEMIEKNKAIIQKALNNMKVNILPQIKEGKFDSNLSIAIADASAKYGIDVDTIISIMKIESNFQPFLFNLNQLSPYQINVIKMMPMDFGGLNVQFYQLGEKKFCSIQVNNLDMAKILFNYLVKNNINVDVGLMQVNTYHFKDYNVQAETIFNASTNIDIGVATYKECYNRYKGDRTKSVECYNKGKFKGITSYYLKFANVYNKISGI